MMWNFKESVPDIYVMTTIKFNLRKREPAKQKKNPPMPKSVRELYNRE